MGKMYRERVYSLFILPLSLSLPEHAISDEEQSPSLLCPSGLSELCVLTTFRGDHLPAQEKGNIEYWNRTLSPDCV